MTTAYVLLWTLAVGAMAAGWIAVAVAVAGVAALFGARWWIERKAEATVMPPPIRDL
jgi:hypothetical protein